MEELSDEMIMMEVREGNLQRASVLFERYNKRIYNFLVKLTFDRELGHDLTQNTFLRLLKYRKTFKEGSKFQSWIYQMARNISADHYRKNKILQSDNVAIETVKNQLESIDEEMVKNEKEQLLYIALFKLPVAQREVLILTRFQQLKHEEVAKILDTSVANIKVKVHRALGALREKYLELEKI